jgi:hypothetical protein
MTSRHGQDFFPPFSCPKVQILSISVTSGMCKLYAARSVRQRTDQIDVFTTDMSCLYLLCLLHALYLCSSYLFLVEKTACSSSSSCKHFLQ